MDHFSSIYSPPKRGTLLRPSIPLRQDTVMFLLISNHSYPLILGICLASATLLFTGLSELPLIWKLKPNNALSLHCSIPPSTSRLDTILASNLVRYISVNTCFYRLWLPIEIILIRSIQVEENSPVRLKR
jgi:hypothetical protein